MTITKNANTHKPFEVKQKLSVLITDDHQMVRDGIRIMLESYQKKYEYKIYEAESGEEALKKTSTIEIDIVLLDYRLPNIDGAETAQRIRNANPKIKIIAMSNFDELAYISNMINAGANGYVLKNIDPFQLSTAIETVMNNKKYFSNDVAVKLIDSDIPTTPSNTILKDRKVSKREIEVFKLIIKAYSNGEIAEKLKVTKRTIDSHKQNLLNKLNVKNTPGLIVFAYKNNLMESLA